MAKYINNLQDLEQFASNYQQNGKISRIIHQTYKSEQLPEHWQPSKQNWIDLHDDWLYVFWNDDMLREIVDLHYHFFLQKYDSYPYFIQKVDAARIFMLHRYGGIYSDMDLKPLRKMDELLRDTEHEQVYLLSNNGRFTNMFMMSQPKADFWDKVWQEMLNPEYPWYHGLVRHFYILTTTGPFVIDRVANTYHKTIGYLPSLLFQPCSNCQPKPCKVDDAYLEMLDGGSWGRWDSKMVQVCCCYWHYLIIVLIIIIILLVVLYIYYKNYM